MIIKHEQANEIAVAKVDDIPNGGVLKVTVEKRSILLCKIQNRVFAVSALCPHRGAPLNEGRMEGALLRCPWHGIKFDVRTGSRACAPICADLKVYPVVIKEELIWLSPSSNKEV